MKQRLIIMTGLAGVGLLSAMLGGCSSQPSTPTLSADEVKNFRGSAPPANMGQLMQNAQQNWQKHHPGAAVGGPGGAARPDPHREATNPFLWGDKV